MSCDPKSLTVVELVTGLRHHVTTLMTKIENEGRVSDRVLPVLADLSELRFLLEGLDQTVQEISNHVRSR